MRTNTSPAPLSTRAQPAPSYHPPPVMFTRCHIHFVDEESERSDAAQAPQYAAGDRPIVPPTFAQPVGPSSLPISKSPLVSSPGKSGTDIPGVVIGTDGAAPGVLVGATAGGLSPPGRGVANGRGVGVRVGVGVLVGVDEEAAVGCRVGVDVAVEVAVATASDVGVGEGVVVGVGVGASVGGGGADSWSEALSIHTVAWPPSVESWISKRTRLARAGASMETENSSKAVEATSRSTELSRSCSPSLSSKATMSCT